MTGNAYVYAEDFNSVVAQLRASEKRVIALEGALRLEIAGAESTLAAFDVERNPVIVSCAEARKRACERVLAATVTDLEGVTP